MAGCAIPGSVVYARRPSGPSREPVDDFVRRCQLAAGAWARLDTEGRFHLLVETLRQTPGDCPPDRSQVVVAGLIHEITGRFLRDAAQDEVWMRLARQAPSGTVEPARESAGADTLHPHVRTAIAIVLERSTDPKLTLDTVAQAVGVSRWHLSRLLKRGTGTGFRALLASIRVSQVRRLLRKTPLSIKEIAARTGYEHVSNLDRHFRQYSGTTPRHYRALVRRTP